MIFIHHHITHESLDWECSLEFLHQNVVCLRCWGYVGQVNGCQITEYIYNQLPIAITQTWAILVVIPANQTWLHQLPIIPIKRCHARNAKPQSLAEDCMLVVGATLIDVAMWHGHVILLLGNGCAFRFITPETELCSVVKACSLGLVTGMYEYCESMLRDTQMVWQKEEPQWGVDFNQFSIGLAGAWWKRDPITSKVSEKWGIKKI